MVRETLQRAQRGRCTAFMSVVNLGEVLYITERERGLERTQETLARLNELIACQREWGAKRNRRYIGQTLEVIIERIAEDGATARTAFNKPVKLERTGHAVGEFARVEIVDAKISSFLGNEVG